METKAPRAAPVPAAAVSVTVAAPELTGLLDKLIQSGRLCTAHGQPDVVWMFAVKVPPEGSAVNDNGLTAYPHAGPEGTSIQTRWLLTSEKYTSPRRSRAMPDGATLVGP